MFKLIFLHLILIHLLGDYYFQTKNLAREKNKSTRKLIEHGLIYAVVCLIGIMPIYDSSILAAVIFLSVSHFSIDIIKHKYTKYLSLKDDYQPVKERFVYMVDQILHIACIFVIAYVLTAGNYAVTVSPLIKNVFDIIELPYIDFLSWSLLLLLVWKPANITIKQLLCLNKPSENDGKKAGGFIGLLERLIILLFLSIDQYSAIGLVLTAKSIARYDEISRNKDFAEYYLLGTLLSTFIVIGAYLMVI